MANCTKVKYPNSRTAIGALRAIRSKNAHRSGKQPVAIHLCGFCHVWHLTSHKPAGKMARQWNALI